MKLKMYHQAVEAYKNAIHLDPPDTMKIRQSLNDALDLRKVGKMSEVSISPTANWKRRANPKSA